MKAMMFVVFIILIPTMGFAQTSKSTPSDTDYEHLCEGASTLAKQFMESRQKGAAMSDLMKVAEGTPEMLRPLAKALVVDAYSKPRWNSTEMALREIGDFRDRNYLNCIKSMKGK